VLNVDLLCSSVLALQARKLEQSTVRALYARSSIKTSQEMLIPVPSASVFRRI
jgi:hypothetical protein